MVDATSPPGSRRRVGSSRGRDRALTVLAGDPRAPDERRDHRRDLDHRPVRPRRPATARRSSACSSGGGALGGALSAIQWLPGIGFLHSSQRASDRVLLLHRRAHSTSRSLSTNVLVPFIVGGNGNFGLPIYAGGYNLPEVTIGTGLVGLVAAGRIPPEPSLDSIRTWLEARTAPAGARLGTAYTLVVVGGLLTLGGNTFLARTVLVHVPLYSGERLQNRNAVIFDLGFTLLVAFFVDDLLAGPTRPRSGRPAAAPATGGRAVPRSLAEHRARTIGPLAAAPIALIAAFVAPARLGHHLGVSGSGRRCSRTSRPYLIPSLALAVVARRVRGRRPLPAGPDARHRCRALFVLVDLAHLPPRDRASLSVPTSALAATSPSSGAIAALAGPNGRTAIYNVAGQSLGPDPVAAEKYGVTDLNLLDGLPSVQGYGSIVNSGYDDETNTHLFEDIATTSLDGPIFDQLNLHTLLTPAAYLDIAIPGGTTPPIAIGNGKFTAGPGVAARRRARQVRTRSRRRSRRRSSSPLRGTSTTSRSIFNTANGGSDGTASPLAARTSGEVVTAARSSSDGRRCGFPASLADDRVRRHRPRRAARRDRRRSSSSPASRASGSSSTERSRTSSRRHTGPSPAISVRSRRSEPPRPRRRRGSSPRPGSPRPARHGQGASRRLKAIAPSVMDVNAPDGGTLVRSEEYAHGWTARLRPTGGGATVVLPVAQDGLIQKVTIPPGRYTVTWRYAPTGLLVGLVLTGVIGTCRSSLLCWWFQFAADRVRGHRRREAVRRVLPSAPTTRE